MAVRVRKRLHPKLRGRAPGDGAPCAKFRGQSYGSLVPTSTAD